MTDQTAAVIVEPIQGEGGIIVPPDGYLKQVEELCHAKGALLIADEVQTGMGRTGRWFGCDHDGARPDLMAVSKALGGGVMPIGAFVGTAQAWAGFVEAPFIHTSTFGGGEMACAAGVATLQVIEEEGLLDKAARDGAYFKAGLEKIAAEFPRVLRTVRGRGMMMGLELTKEGAGGMLMALMIAQHVLVAYTLNNPKVIRIEPPLILPVAVIDQVLALLHDAVRQVDEVIDDL